MLIEVFLEIYHLLNVFLIHLVLHQMLVLLFVVLFCLFDDTQVEDVLVTELEILSHLGMVILYELMIFLYLMQIISVLDSPDVVVLEPRVQRIHPFPMEFN